MSKEIRITQVQLRAIEKVVGYSIDDERDHLEEEIATDLDKDVSDLTDDDLYSFCKENDYDLDDHIWFALYELQKLTELNLV